jgi:hypothetical protein
VAQLSTLGGSRIYMKKSHIILIAVFVAYAAIYLFIRSSCHGIERAGAMDAQGVYQPKTYQVVMILEPLSGFQRHVKQVVYVAFYPMGCLDRLITGRLYVLVEKRHEPIKKPKP